MKKIIAMLVLSTAATTQAHASTYEGRKEIAKQLCVVVTQAYVKAVSHYIGGTPLDLAITKGRERYIPFKAEPVIYNALNDLQDTWDNMVPNNNRNESLHSFRAREGMVQRNCEAEVLMSDIIDRFQ